MARLINSTRQFVSNEVGVAALAYAASSSVMGMALAVAVDLALHGRRLLLTA